MNIDTIKINIKNFFTLNRDRILPLILTGIVILADQFTKFIIVKNWPVSRFTVIKDVFNNGFFQIIHVRNKAIAFSLGEKVPEIIKPVAFIIFPILVMGFLFWYYLKTDEFTRLQRWAAAGIIGGGLGNIIDRIFRADGVVDFIDVRFYGLFGLERWPTFNVADASVVVCCIILFITIIFDIKKNNKEEASG